jgi:hypothetical protein
VEKKVKQLLLALVFFSLSYSVPMRVILNNNTDQALSVTVRCEATGPRELALLSLPSSQKNVVEFDSQGQCNIEAIFRNNPYDRPKYQGVLGLNIERETTMYGDYNLIWTRGGVRPPGTDTGQTKWEIDYTINKKR